MIVDPVRFKPSVTPALFNEKKLAWKPVVAVIAHVEWQDPKLSIAGRLTAVVSFGVNLYGVVRAVFSGVEWEAMPRAANDEGVFAVVMKGLHPAEAEHLKLTDVLRNKVEYVCQRCGSHDEETGDVIPTEVRIGVKLKFSAMLCGDCSNALVSLVRPFLKEVPPDDDGPRSIIV